MIFKVKIPATPLSGIELSCTPAIVSCPDPTRDIAAVRGLGFCHNCEKSGSGLGMRLAFLASNLQILFYLNLVPKPHPAFHSLQYGDKKPSPAFPY